MYMEAQSFSQQQEKSAPAIGVDVHMHTHHSHGQHSTEAMYQSAVDKKLSIIGFSEHSPRPEGYAYPNDYQDKLRKHLPIYVQEVRDMAKRGQERDIKVLLGLEVDYIPGQENYAEALTKAYPDRKSVV